MVIAWVLTLPAAALVAALVWEASDALGGVAGSLVMAIIAAARQRRCSAAQQRGATGGRVSAAIIDFAALWKILVTRSPSASA